MTTILTLAIGIGATTAIFSVANAVLISPLPYVRADRLVRLYDNVPPPTPNGVTRRIGAIEARDLGELRARSRTLSHIVSYSFATVTVSGCAEAIQMHGAPVSAATASMLTVEPAIGRWFTSDEETSDSKVVVLSERVRRRCLGNDPDVTGRILTFTGRAAGPMGGNIALGPYTVIGVMPSVFQFPDDSAQFWIPRSMTPSPDGRPRRTGALARLANGVSLDAAASEINSILGNLHGAGATARSSAPRFDVVRAEDEIGAPVKLALIVLMIAVGLVLLIACANVASLLLSRATSRRREIAVRIAIGAGRGQVIRQVLTESLVLALFGGIGGVCLALGGIRLFQQLGASLARFDLSAGISFPRLAAITVDGRALAFTLLVSIACGVMFGLAPAVRSWRIDQMDALRDGAAWLASGLRWRRRLSVQSALIVCEISMAMALLVSGGLFVRSFLTLTNVDPGFRAANVLTFQVGVPGEQHPAREMKAFADELVARLRTAPDIQGTAYANQLPTVNLRDTAGGLWRTPDPARPGSPDGPDARLVSQDYLATLGIPIIAGRGFTERDTAGQSRVLVVNDTFARSEFPSENPVGQIVFVGNNPVPWTIVGIAGDVRQFGLDHAPEPQFFADLRQWPETGRLTLPVGPYYAVRTSGDPAAALVHVREIVRSLEPLGTIDNVATLDALIANSMTRPRLYAVMVSVFAAIAAGLAAVGIYGVMTYAVSRRTREIGIRMALGARRSEVLSLVLRESGALTLTGIVIGLASAIAASRYLESLLFATTPFDPITLASAFAVFTLIAAVASYLPARRAMLVDPTVALRSE